MKSFVYAAQFTADQESGGYVITFPDLPEAISQGETIAECMLNAADCLEEAIANRLELGLTLPDPSPMETSLYAIPLPVLTAAKAALSLALLQAKVSKIELARRLDCNEKEVRRLLDPRHPSKLPRIERALSALGYHFILGVQEAA